MSSPSVYRKITRALFWGIMMLLSVISFVVMNKLDVLWNVWANLIDMVLVFAIAFALSRLIPRWLDIADDR